MVRDPDKMYDAQEAYQILHKAGAVNKAYDLTDEIISSSCVCSTRLNSIVTVVMMLLCSSISRECHAHDVVNF